jgi:hypothetical protein
MSNYLAIATVTAAIKQILAHAVQAVPGALVTTLRPHDSENAEAQTPRTNLYLYQVTPNAAWRNNDLPTRRADEQLVQRPQAALNLHYLLTFYGNETELEPQRLLGIVVRTLHSQPVLSRQIIRDTIASSFFKPFLERSNLADQIELVRFTPISLSTEELSKIWSVLFQVPYALSIAYQGAVVLIESEETPHEVLPVRERGITVVPFRHPVIEKVVSQTGADQPILAGSTVIIIGRQLHGEITGVRVDDTEITKLIAVNDDKISLALTSESLRAGVRGIKVIHKIRMGTPATEHQGFESTMAAFVLCPVISKDNGNYDIEVLEETLDQVKVTKIIVHLNPKVGKQQKVVLLLNEFLPPTNRPALAYRINAQPRDTDTDSVEFHISKEITNESPVRLVESGNYLVRVRVDGAESPLVVNPDPSDPRYIDPRVMIAWTP